MFLSFSLWVLFFNYALSKRAEILEKSSVTDFVKDSLMSSPLTEKIVGLSVKDLQDEFIAKPPR